MVVWGWWIWCWGWMWMWFLVLVSQVRGFVEGEKAFWGGYIDREGFHLTVILWGKGGSDY